MIVLLSTTADNAVPLIVIDGSQITNIAQRLGLQLQADGRSVQGLVIRIFGGIGVVSFQAAMTSSRATSSAPTPPPCPRKRTAWRSA